MVVCQSSTNCGQAVPTAHFGVAVARRIVRPSRVATNVARDSPFDRIVGDSGRRMLGASRVTALHSRCALLSVTCRRMPRWMLDTFPLAALVRQSSPADGLQGGIERGLVASAPLGTASVESTKSAARNPAALLLRLLVRRATVTATPSGPLAR